MWDEIHKLTFDGVNDIRREGTVNVTKIAVAPDTIFAGPVVPTPAAELLARLPRKITEEEEQWSPTRHEVDAYIDFLEKELLQSCEDMRQRPGNRYEGAAPIKDRPSNFFDTFFWGMLAITAGCFWWLARIILKALS